MEPRPHRPSLALLEKAFTSGELETREVCGSPDRISLSPNPSCRWVGQSTGIHQLTCSPAAPLNLIPSLNPLPPVNNFEGGSDAGDSLHMPLQERSQVHSSSARNSYCCNTLGATGNIPSGGKGTMNAMRSSSFR